MSDFIKPVVGMGCTIHIGSDSYPYTVVDFAEHSSAMCVKVQADSAQPGEGHDYYGKQVWTFKPNPKGDIRLFRFEHSKADRGWREVVKSRATGGYVLRVPSTYRLVVGERSKFSDPSF